MSPAAQITATDIGIWIMVFAFLIQLYINLRKAGGQGDKVLITPQPIQTERKPKPVLWDEHAALVRRVERLEGEINALRSEAQTNHLELMDAGDNRKEEIFSRINQIHDHLNQRISEIGMEQANAIGELRGEIRRIE